MSNLKIVESENTILDNSSKSLLCPICGSSKTRIGYALVNITDSDKIVTMGVTCEKNHVYCLQFSDGDGSVALNVYGAYELAQSKAQELSNKVIRRTKSELGKEELKRISG
jgi:C4-type Zn-finger protein